LAVGVVLILSRFVPVFYGPGFEPVIPIIQVFVLMFPILGCSNVIGLQYLVPTGREKLLTVSVFSGALVNVVLNLFLIRAFAARGAAIASVVAELVVSAVQFYFVRREIRVISVLKLLFRYGIFAAIMGGVGYTVSLYAPQGILGIALIVLPCVAIYGILLLVTRDPVFSVFKKSKTVEEKPSEI
jgi:O-antigen/teichoic acid export membrane protein